LAEELGTELTNHCVECHMASRRDVEGTMETAKGNLLPLLRDHFIQAKPEGAEEMVKELQTALQKKRRGNP
jgi:hypothetical protein